MKHLQKFLPVGLSLLAIAGPALATAPAQPDTADAIAYIAAGIVTVLAVFTGKYTVMGVMWLARRVGSAVGR
jgi:hypothetical protein